MKKIQLLNKISATGTKRFGENYTVASECENPEGIMVRSAAMLEMTFGKALEAIARAGAGVNNIPCDRWRRRGHCCVQTHRVPRKTPSRSLRFAR